LHALANVIAASAGAGDSKFLRRFGDGELRRRFFWLCRTFTATKIGEQEELWRQLFLGFYFFSFNLPQHWA